MAFLRPEDVVKALPIERGMAIVDLGAGMGTFTIPLAKMVGEKGRVYAVDIKPEFLEAVSASAKSAGLNNVEVISGDLEKEEGSGLKDGVFDMAILTNVLFQSENKSAIIAEARRILKKSGLVLIIDWKESFGGLGPHEKHVVNEDDVKKLFLNYGFALYNEVKAGDYHYGLLFRKL